MGKGLNNYQFNVVDEKGAAITSGLKVSVFTAGSTSATIYSDSAGTSLTNPITATVFNALSNGVVEFWAGATSVDVTITDGLGFSVFRYGLTPKEHTLVFDENQAVGGVLGNISGTDLADASGAFVDYAETVTLDASKLRAGDIVKINGWLVIDDYNSTDTLDFKVFASAVTLLHTGDMSLVNDNDFLRFEITGKVITAGASGKIIWTALMWTSIAGTIALKNGTVEDGISLAGTTLDMSGDVIIKASGDYSVAHADNESQVLWDVQVIKGTVTS